MSKFFGSPESNPALPTGGQGLFFIDAVTNKLCYMDGTGRVTGPISRNNAIASQGAGFAADTYVTGSGLIIPSFGMKVGMLFQWTITASKTAAGIAGAVYTIRIGSAQSTADTARLALTAGAQTAAADNGTLIVSASVRVVGAATGVIAGAASWMKTQPGTAGLGGSIDGVSSAFDNTTTIAGQYVGLSINGGASAAWTISSCDAWLSG